MLSKTFDAQTIDVIRWSEPEPGTLAYCYPMLDMEVQIGAQLVVHEGERAMFVDDGRIADVLGPGAYALNAANLPVLAGMKRWAKEFVSAFRADVYFFSTCEETGQRWGTSTPIALSDEQLGEVRVRGFGGYAYRIVDVRRFFAQVSGTRESFFVYDLDDRLRSAIAGCMADVLAETGLLGQDMTANAAALRGILREEIQPVLARLGLELTEFSVEGISLQDADEDAMECRCCGARMRVEEDVLKCDYCHAVVGVAAEIERHACPVCAIPLLQATVGGASLLCCTRCDGMLVAMEEFETLVAAARALPGGAVVMEAARTAVDCPECGLGMHGDVCDGCGLRWLNRGELARIAHGSESEYGVGGAGVYFNPTHADSLADSNMSA